MPRYTYRMDNSDIKDRQLNALVGGALRGLVESGADDEAVGSFAQSYRLKAAKILGFPEEALNPPDLTSVIKEAVTQALEATGALKPKKSRKQNDRFTVIIKGQRTSITIHQDVTAQLLQVKGSKSAVSSFVRDVAKDVPESAENKSQWIEDRIAKILHFEDGAAALESDAARH